MKLKPWQIFEFGLTSEKKLLTDPIQAWVVPTVHSIDMEINMEPTEVRACRWISCRMVRPSLSVGSNQTSVLVYSL